MATRTPTETKPSIESPSRVVLGAREIAIPIEGMTCASRVRHVETALAKVSGVQAANVNLATERATVAYDPAQASVSQLAEAVTKSGVTSDRPVAGARARSLDGHRRQLGDGDGDGDGDGGDRGRGRDCP